MAALITRAKGDPEAFTKSERDDIRNVINLIAYSCFHENFGPLLRTAENFEYSFLRVPKGFMSGGSAYSVGSLHSRNVISSPELKERFDAPGYILDPMGSNPNRTTLSILTEACADSAKRELGRRILRALDFVRLAYVNYTGVAEANRVVLLCTAFEALLLRGKSGAKAKPIGEKLDELLAPGEPREARKDSRGEHTKLGWWFRDFYSLRNSIVHGNTVSASEFEFQTKNARRSRFLAAVMLFDCALKEHLLQNGFGSEDDFSRSVRLVTLREHLFR